MCVRWMAECCIGGSYLVGGLGWLRSGCCLHGRGIGSGRTAYKSQPLRKQGTKAEAEHDFLNGDVTPHEAVLVVACVLEVQLVDVGNLMQEDFAHGHRRGDADLGRLPIAALLFNHTPKRKEADFFGHKSEMENPATNANAFAQREVERETRKTQPESDVVVNALQLGPGGQPGRAKPGVLLGCPDQGRQSLRCSPDVAEHERKPGVSGQLVGKGPKGGGREG